jgi:hypothetical protein
MPNDARGGINPQDARTLRNQAGQDARTADQIRQMMQQAGIKDLTTIEEAIRALRALENERAYADPMGLQQLQATAIQKVQQLELDLRKRLDKTSDQLFLNGSPDVPANAKELVNEYFRQLSRKAGGGK